MRGRLLILSLLLWAARPHPAGRRLSPRYRPPHFSEEAKWALFVVSLFLSNPYKYPQGAAPMMSASNPFIYAYTPGWAPYEHPFSPDSLLERSLGTIRNHHLV